ncbi:MAG: carbohydrate kinase [Spirochaetia bacterium]|nr:carbohydrate kinase [Spirochaetia bacterium]
MESYYLGIDNGGTLCKAVLFNAQGKAVSSAARKLRMITPKPGFTERDMEELWQVNLDVIREAAAAAEVDPTAIRGVACSGHGKGLYLWGKDNQPCGRGIVSTDSRAWEYPGKWEQNGIAEKVFEKTYQKILASQPVSLLSWIKDNEPERADNIRWIFEVKDYIRFRLTGEAFAEITDYSGSNMLNLKERRFDRELLALFGLEEFFEALPPLKKSVDVCGAITAEVAEATGLAVGTPVAGGMFDIDACAIAMDITDESNICVIAGTWSINEFISRKPVLNHSIMMNSIYCIDDYYLIEECSPTSAGNLEWYVNMFMAEEKQAAAAKGISVYQYCDEMAASVPIGSESTAEAGLIFLPYIYGSNYQARAKACFVGMDSRTTREEIVRAVFEGIVFCHLVHIEKLLMNRQQTKAVRLAGGAAKSRFWAQMFSDVIGLPVEIIEADELGALGVAMAAAVSAGDYDSLESAAEKMVVIRDRLEPDTALHEIYAGKFELYKRVSRQLEPIWEGA